MASHGKSAPNRLNDIADTLEACERQEVCGRSLPQTVVPLLAEAECLGAFSGPECAAVRLALARWRNRGTEPWDEVVGRKVETDPSVITYQRVVSALFPDLADTEEEERELEIPREGAESNAEEGAVEKSRLRHKVGKCELHLWTNWAVAAPRIADILRLVSERSTGKEDEGEGTATSSDFTNPAHAKAWLQSQVRPRLESLHSCYGKWVGSAIANTAVEITSPTDLSPQARTRQLSLIRQHIVVVRDWALRNALPGVPSAPPQFKDREEAQSIFSEWCAYLDRLAKRGHGSWAGQAKQSEGSGGEGSESGVSAMTAREKRFRIALSFPGEHRAFVEQMAAHLAASVGQERVLYDKYHEAEFARLDLDTYLQHLYHEQSELIAVFLCADYERKEWCGLEWRAIRDLIKRRHSCVVMPFRFDNTEIPGLFSTDGYIWIGDRTPKQAAELILKRLEINAKNDSASGVSTATSQVGIPPQAVARGNPTEESAQAVSTSATSGEYEDGTNVPRGTPFFVQVTQTQDWYRPDESKSPAGWKERWARLRARFEQIVDEFRPMACLLIEQRIPAYPEFALSCEDGLARRELIQGGGGLAREGTFLFTRDREPLFGVFAVRDVKGTPISNSAGEPFGFRFGLSRQFVVYSERNNLEESRALPGPRLRELARDGTGLLYQLPANVAISLWRNWRSGFSRREHSNEYLWLDALFELSWQRKPGDVLHTRREAWLENTSITLDGQGLFPRLPDLSLFPGSISIPADNGYPVAWRCTLPDVARASVIAIDELLERASDVPG